MRLFQTTTFGELSGKRTKRVSELIKHCSQAGIPSVFCKEMDAWQKTHVAMVSCIANALYQHDCDNISLSQSWNDVKEMILSIQKSFRLLEKIGVPTTPKKLMLFWLPTTFLWVQKWPRLPWQSTASSQERRCSF